jgi:hypothetical protein
MIIQNINTEAKLTLTRNEYYASFYNNYDWVNITPERTQKQVAQALRFVKLGKLHRTKANLDDVIRTFGSQHGLFSDSIIALNKLIKELK